MISNLSIKTKLMLLLLAPLLTLLVFSSIAVADRFETAAVANEANDELEVAQSGMVVIGALSNERSTAVQLLINSRDGREKVDAARQLTDEAIADLVTPLNNGSFDLDSRSQALDALQRLAITRQQVDTFAVESAEAYEGYNDLIDEVLALETEILDELGDTELLGQGQLTLAGIQGRERVHRQTAFLGPRLELIELTVPDYVAFSRLENEELLFFSQLGGGDEISELWQTSRNSSAAVAADSLVDAVTVAGQGGSIPNVTATVWWKQMTAKAESFDSAAVGSFETLLANSESKAASAQTGAIIFGVITLLIVLLAVLMALALGRSIARRLLRLSEEANTIATERLPEVLESLRNPTPEALSGAMPTIGSDATDEIGVMSDSFDTVLRTSVETAIEHSQQRAKTITDLLVNLGRRNQTLIGNQLALIDNLESREEDPELLQSLYRLDSLITRNRRNSENLLVLAGVTVSRSSNVPVSLFELVQASMGEVSELERIEITGEDTDNAMLLGKPAVNLSHLVAELLDNALSFSAKTTKVTAHVQSKSGENRIWVIDQGVGMTDEELDEANTRLADPTDIDKLSTERIGFQVIGRIAQQLGVTVALTRNPYGGISASVDLPRDLLLTKAAPATEIPEPPTAVPASSHQADRLDDGGSLENAQTSPVETGAISAPTLPRNEGTGTILPNVAPTNETAARRGSFEPGAAPLVEATTQASAPEPMPTPEATGKLKQRTPGTSLASDLKTEAAGHVTHRRLADGRPTDISERAEQRKETNSKLAQLSAQRRETKDQNHGSAPTLPRNEGTGTTLPNVAPTNETAARRGSFEPGAAPLVEATTQASAPEPMPTPEATGKLKQRTPGMSLASDLKTEAAGHVTHRRLADGRPTDISERAEQRKETNSKLAQLSAQRRETKDQNQ